MFKRLYTGDAIVGDKIQQEEKIMKHVIDPMLYCVDFADNHRLKGQKRELT